jgi:hypothetical protein
MKRAAALLSCLLAGCAWGPKPGTPPALGRAKDLPPLSLEAANARWQGARCRTRLPIELKSGPDGRGWYSNGAGGLYVQGTGNDTAFHIYVRASQRDPQPGRSIGPGTELVAEGWELQKPDENKGPVLVLRFASHPGRMRFEFKTPSAFSTSGFPLSRLAEVEQYVRLYVLDVEAADEQLVPVEGTSR